MSARTLAVSIGIAALLAASPAGAQQPPVPQPFPRPAAPRNPSAPETPAQPAPAPPAAETAAPPAQPEAPTEAMLGVPIFPNAEFLQSFDAGRGQRYYLFGIHGSFADAVAYYRTALKQRGNVVFDAPAVHMFEVGRFREETMAFPPGVTIKDYTWNGSAGYLHHRPGAESVRYRTILQIVPVVPDRR
jgi:hypothetical protein